MVYRNGYGTVTARSGGKTMVPAFELVALIAACVIMYRIAEAEDRSPGLWTGLTFLLCLGSGFLPLPLTRIAIATAVSYGLMLACNLLKPEKAPRRIV
jgi:hypothetical protein